MNAQQLAEQEEVNQAHDIAPAPEKEKYVVFGVGYYPNRLAPVIVHCGVAGAHRIEVLEVLRAHCRLPLPENEPGMRQLANEIRASLFHTWEGHGYWLQIEGHTSGYQEYGTL